jgi:hypothetical protein
MGNELTSRQQSPNDDLTWLWIAEPWVRHWRGQRIKAVEVERVLQIALKENPPPSMRQVIKRLNHSKPTIYRHIPVLCRAISERYTDYRSIRSAVRRELAREEVKAMANELHAKGIKLTRNQIRPLLTSSDYLNLPEGRAALQEVKRELGLCAN